MNWITHDGILARISMLLSSALILLTPRRGEAQAPTTAEVHLEVPENRAGCDGTDFFLREFHRALGPRRSMLVVMPRIDVWIEEVEPDAFQLELLVARGWTDSFRSQPRIYGPPTECSKVVAYAADIAATMVLPAEASPPRPRVHTRTSDMLVGTQASYGLSPQFVSLGPYVTVGVPLSSKLALEMSLSLVPPYTWHTNKGRVVDIKFSAAATAALCYRWDIAGLCPSLTIGGFDGTAPYIEHASDDVSTHYLTAGIEVYAEKRWSPAAAVRVGGLISGTSITPALQIGGKVDWQGTPLTATLKVGWMVW